MTKFRLIAAAAIAGVVTLLSSGAALAENYPEPPITITIDDDDMIGGVTFGFTIDSGSTECDWKVTYADGRAPGVSAVQTGSGTSISGSYKTKVVNSVFRSPIKVVCTYVSGADQTASTDDGVTAPAFFSTSDASSTLQAATATAAASATITLRPLSSTDGSALPDTGGSNLSLFLLAGGLVLVGGGVTYMARRRQSSH